MKKVKTGIQQVVGLPPVVIGKGFSFRSVAVQYNLTVARPYTERCVAFGKGFDYARLLGCKNTTLSRHTDFYVQYIEPQTYEFVGK